MLMTTGLQIRIREKGVDRGVIVVGFVSEGCLSMTRFPSEISWHVASSFSSPIIDEIACLLVHEMSFMKFVAFCCILL